MFQHCHARLSVWRPVSLTKVSLNCLGWLSGLSALHSHVKANFVTNIGLFGIIRRISIPEFSINQEAKLEPRLNATILRYSMPYLLAVLRIPLLRTLWACWDRHNNMRQRSKDDIFGYCSVSTHVTAHGTVCSSVQIRRAGPVPAGSRRNPLQHDRQCFPRTSAATAYPSFGFRPPRVTDLFLFLLLVGMDVVGRKE